MPRIRYLKPDFFTDEDLADLPFEARLTFAGLWCHADKAGRMEDRPKYLKAMIFPYDNVNIEKQLTELTKPKTRTGLPFIVRYNVNGGDYIQILNWDKHQKPHHTEKDSIIPALIDIPKRKEEEKNTYNGEGQHDELELSNGEITVKERLKNQDTEKPKIFITIPLVNKKEHPITEIEIADFQESYPAIDVRQCLREIRAWNLANPKNRKTRTGILRHINQWLGKEQNKAKKTGGIDDAAQEFLRRHGKDK